jgi:hypothetical protein
MKRRGRALNKRYGRAKGGGMPALTEWSSFAGGSYSIVYEGRTYVINPKHRLDEHRRSGGWALSFTPAIRGLHGWITKDGVEHGGGFTYDFKTPQAAVAVARAFASKIGPEPHGIMKAWGAQAAKIDAIMAAPDFWSRVERLKEEAVAAGDTNMARICRVAISEREIRPTGHDARECAQAMLHGGA